MINLFNTLLYQPLFNILVILVNIIPNHDLGWAIIALTIIIRLILYPLSAKALKSQQALQGLQPKLKEIQENHKNDPTAKQKALMTFYQQNKINPLSSCLPLIIQFPILIALYQVFIKGLDTNNFHFLYSFVNRPENFNVIFLGLINLNQPNAILAILTGASQYLQTKLFMPKITQTANSKNSSSMDDFSKIMSKQMLYFMPVFITFIAWRLPSGLAIYWLASTIFTIVQQHILVKKYKEKKI